MIDNITYDTFTTRYLLNGLYNKLVMSLATTSKKKIARYICLQQKQVLIPSTFSKISLNKLQMVHDPKLGRKILGHFHGSSCLSGMQAVYGEQVS